MKEKIVSFMRLLLIFAGLIFSLFTANAQTAQTPIADSIIAACDTLERGEALRLVVATRDSLQAVRAEYTDPRHPDRLRLIDECDALTAHQAALNGQPAPQRKEASRSSRNGQGQRASQRQLNKRRTVKCGPKHRRQRRTGNAGTSNRLTRRQRGA